MFYLKVTESAEHSFNGSFYFYLTYDTGIMGILVSPLKW